MKGSCCLRGGLAGKNPKGEVDGPPVIPGAELPQPESGVARRVQTEAAAAAGTATAVKMVAKQRIRMANEKHSKNITQRGNVAKTSVGARRSPVFLRRLGARLLAPFPATTRSSRRAGTPVPSPREIERSRRSLSLRQPSHPARLPLPRSTSLCFGDPPRLGNPREGFWRGGGRGFVPKAAARFPSL